MKHFTWATWIVTSFCVTWFRNSLLYLKNSEPLISVNVSIKINYIKKCLSILIILLSLSQFYTLRKEMKKFYKKCSILSSMPDKMFGPQWSGKTEQVQKNLTCVSWVILEGRLDTRFTYSTNFEIAQISFDLLRS